MLNPLHNRIFTNTALSPKTHRFTPGFFAKTLRFTLRIRRKRKIPFLLWICYILPKAHSFTQRFHQQQLFKLCAYAKNAKFDSAFSPKTIWKRTVTKTALSLMSRFRQQRSAMLCAFGKNGELSKTLNISANLRIFFENVGRTAFCIY